MASKATKALALAFALAALGTLALAGSAGAELSFCPKGSGAGQCETESGSTVAADPAAGRVYIPDWYNQRVDVFDAEGNFIRAFGWGVADGTTKALQSCTAICFRGIAGSGSGQFFAPLHIAVDDSGGPGQGDIYVSDFSYRIQKFDPEGNLLGTIGSKGSGECEFISRRLPIDVGPGGVLYVADTPDLGQGEKAAPTRIQRFSPAGACLGEVQIFEGALQAEDLAVDSGANAYVTVRGHESAIEKYDPSGSLIEVLDSGTSSNAIAIDAADILYAAQRDNGLAAVAAYDSSGEILSRFGYFANSVLYGVAPLHGPDGDVFVSKGRLFPAIRYLAQPDPGPLVAPLSFLATPIGNTKATLRAEINPEGKPTEYHVEYLSEADFQAQGESFVGPLTKSSPTVALDFSAGKEFLLRPAEAAFGCPVATKQLIEEDKCLEPETSYRSRIIASNADNPSGAGVGTVVGAFTTKKAIDTGEPFASKVSTDSIRLNASVNPLGIPASGYFEYVDEQSFEESGFATAARLPDTEGGEAPLEFGNSEVPTLRGAILSGLPEGASYRYRLHAENLFGQFTGPTRSFTTLRSPRAELCPNNAFRYGPGAYLPDCRAYEMVSPTDKAGGDIILANGKSTPPLVLNQASLAGDKVSYGSYRAFGDAASAPYTAQYIAGRSASGWSSHGVDPTAGKAIKPGAILEQELRALSDDLCEAWITPFFEPPLDEAAVAGYPNIYRATDPLCGPASYEAVTTAKPATVEGDAQDYKLELQGHSADGSVAAFAVAGSLEGSGAPTQPECQANGIGCKPTLYAKGLGTGTAFVCVKPGGVKSSNTCLAGTNHGAVPDVGSGIFATFEDALSADGKRIFWTDSLNDGRIYVRENPLGKGGECAKATAPCTKNVSAAGEALSGTSASHFLAAAEDGARAVYRTATSLVGVEGYESVLYEYDLEAEATKLIAGEAGGLVGASEDARRIFFTSREAIAGSGQNPEGAEAEAGEPNLYFHEAGEGAGSYRFVATLSDADADPGPRPTTGNSAVAFEPIYHSGRVSADGLHAAFNSTEPLTGFDNTDANSGEADSEVFVYEAVPGGAVAGKLRCASCNPGGARPEGADLGNAGKTFWVAGRLETCETSLYCGRPLSADGQRVFFESQDPLSALDTNGKIDVYQWEAVGTGNCAADSPGYSERNQGCVELISSGQGARDAAFMDASEDGDDVFFATLASLVEGDPGQVDVYDARIGGGFAPPPPAQAECEGESCQSPAAAPQATPPASSLYSGPGNLAPVSGSGRCTRSARRAKALSRHAKTLRRSARRARSPLARRKRSRAARRSAKSARNLSRNAKRCRARARAARRSQR